MTPTPITHRLRRAQGTSAHALHLLHQLGRVEVFARTLRGQVVDYAVVRGSLTTHGPTPALALAAARASLNDQRSSDKRILSWQSGLDAGFTPACLAFFCLRNELRPDQPLPLAELRRAVTARRATNQRYARPLRRVGIHLGPLKQPQPMPRLSAPTTPPPAAPAAWPRLLTLTDYAHACAQVVGKPVTRQAIHQRLTSGTLTAEVQAIGDGKPRRYIDTERYPPGPATGRHPHRPAGSVPLPKRPRPAKPRPTA